MGRYFGTDGIRGIANEYLTVDLLLKLGYAVSYILKKVKEKPLVFIGKDTRVSCDMIESALTCKLLSEGVDVVQLDTVSTPCLAFLTKLKKADIGIMISASHNSFEYNGIKIFDKNGYKIDDCLENQIEDILDNNQPINTNKGGNLGCLTKGHNLKDLYVDFIKKSINLNKLNIKIALDCANGSSFSTARDLFSSFCECLYIANDCPNGVNINLDCGSTHIDAIKKLTLENKCDIGFSFDGDADRCLAVDECGQLISGDVIMAIISKYLKDNNKLKEDAFVTTVMSNMGLMSFAKQNNIGLSTTKVGDRFVLEEMLEKGYNFGGEQSGHIILGDFMTTGDGQLAAAFLLKIMSKSNKKASELKNIMRVYPQVLKNIEVQPCDKNICCDVKVIECIEKWNKKLKDDARILVRPSGTEPLIRIMVEGKREEDILKASADICAVIKERLNNESCKRLGSL